MQRRIFLLIITLFLFGIAWIATIFSQHVPLGVILQPQGTGFERDRVFNPTVIVEGDTMYMIYRTQGAWPGSYLALVKSVDGINFVRYSGNPLFGGEDPRVVKFDGTYYLFYGNISLATSQNLINWTQHGTILVPVNSWELSQVKAPGPVPQKINGKYWMYYQGETQPWITKMGLAFSYNLLNWTQLPDPVMIPRPGYFDSWGTEPGVAIIINEGIFLIYNGWGGDGTNRNHVGWALFDIQDPSHVIARCDTPFIYMPNDHVFCEGLTMFNNQWYLYYGAADQWIEGMIVDINLLLSSVYIADVSDKISTLYLLEQNYPNPFNPSTEINYYLPKSGHASLKIYDILGREIKTLVNEYRGIGTHHVGWDATNNLGEMVASGIYVYTLQVKDFNISKKMILMR